MSDKRHHWLHKIDKSAIATVIGIIFLFSFSVSIVLIAPRYVDTTWTSPTSEYQVQMYEISDPLVYISSSYTGGKNLQYVRQLVNDFTLVAFKESDTVRIISDPGLSKYITNHQDKTLTLTPKLLLLREPTDTTSFKGKEKAVALRKSLQDAWEKEHPKWKEEELVKWDYSVLELYDPKRDEVFSLSQTGQDVENWVDADFKIIESNGKHSYHQNQGVIYVQNPQEYLVSSFQLGNEKGWKYDPNGESLKDIEQLKSESLGFRSRKELIELGEHIYAIEGCWYCHTDQTRTLVQDVVLNGSDSYPAPPSSANEYIYQKITFPGTRRIGPDISRVSIKRPGRDWHISHFWAPKTASAGSIMPAFQHFFDFDPRGTSKSVAGVPNYKFEAIYQYMMTKGSRITPPTQAWWLGKDPVRTLEIIEGERRLSEK